MTARIAFCITTLEAGGAERQLVELATRLPSDRFAPVVVVLAAPPRAPTDELVQKLDEHSVPVSFLGGRSLWQSPLIYRRLAKWLRDVRPDLLQCFLAHANVLGACAARRLGIPIVAGIRVAERRLNGHRALQRWTAPLVDRHVCVSQSVADFAERVMRLPREKLLVIPNGVDVARFTGSLPIPLTELGVPPSRRMILFVGRLEPDKRPDWLLDRLPAIAARLPNHDLAIVGCGPLKGRLLRRAVRLGLSDRVHFVGWRPDVPRLLAAADLLVLTSASEGMPNVILEAMAAARPVVATEVYGVKELLGSDSSGQLTPPNNTHAFVDAVVRIAADRDLANRLGQLNLERATHVFSLDQTAARYAALYEALLAAHQSKKPPPKR